MSVAASSIDPKPELSKPTGMNTWLKLDRHRWFAWKEVTQSLPLVLALVILAAIFALTQWVLDGPVTENAEAMRFFANRIQWLVVLVPCIFATGVGAISVGQEREQKTVDWLLSIPVSNRLVIWGKWSVAAAMLGVLWLLSIVLVHWLADGEVSHWQIAPDNANFSNAAYVRFPSMIAHAVFVLTASFYLAWRIRNQFLSLVLLVAVAAIPLVVAETYQNSPLSNPTDLPHDWVWFLVSLLLTPLMLIAMNHRGTIVLAGARTRVGSRGKRLSSFVSTGDVPYFRSPLNAIVWQTIHSSKAVWSVLTIGLLSSAWFVTNTVSPSGKVGPEAMFFVFSTGLMVSWLGVVVFQFSGGVREVRFLGDHGIASRRIWLVRQIVSLSIISLAIVLYTWYTSSVIADPRRYVSDRAYGLPSMLFVLIVVALVYSVSQWVSQWCRTLTISLLIAPIASFGLVSYLFWFWRWSSISPYTLIVIVGLPMFATWWLMPRFVDGRDRPRSIFVAILGTMIILLVPFSTPIYEIANADMKDFDELLQSVGEGREALQDAPTPVPLRFTLFGREDWVGAYLDDQSDNQLMAPEQFAVAMDRLDEQGDRPEDYVQAIEQLRSNETLAADITTEAWQAWALRLMLARVQLRQATRQRAPDELDERDPLEVIGPWLSDTSLMMAALRRSVRCLDQEIADRAEIVLLDTLSMDEMKPFLDDELIKRVVSRFPDRSQRNEVRRRAILASWVNAQNESQVEAFVRDFGGVAIDRTPHSAILNKPHFILMASTDGVAWAGLKALKTHVGDTESVSRWQREMHELVVPPLVSFDSGPYSERIRSMPAMMSMPKDIHSTTGNLFPFRYYAMPWEDEIESLKSSVHEGVSK